MKIPVKESTYAQVMALPGPGTICPNGRDFCSGCSCGQRPERI